MNTAETHLFDKQSDWIIQPMTAFGGFVTSLQFVELGKRPKRILADGAVAEPQPLGRRSAQSYTAMFSKFVRWMKEENLDIGKVTQEHVLRFLDAAMEPTKKGRVKDLNSEIRARYVRLLERLYDHLGANPNPARLAAYSLQSTPGGRGRDLPKEWLTVEQQAAFMEAMPARDSATPVESAKAWRRRRDRAMMALMIGAGLTVSEVIELYIENIGEVSETGSVPVTIWPTPGSEFSRKHVTMLRPFAVSDVVRWLGERANMAVHGKLLFPATRSGGKLASATLYRQVRATFAAAKITMNREGGRTLRNTFAQRELEAGTSIDELGEFLGLHERRSVERYLGQRAVQLRATPEAPAPAEEP